MWVVCCGMQRSGSTLQYQLTTAVVEAAGAGRSLGWITSNAFPDYQNRFPHEKQIQVFKCHVFIPAIAELMAQGQAKAVYVYRDIRDVVVSIMTKKRLTFEQMIQRGSLQSVLEKDRQWSDMDQILISRYEQMITNIPEEVGRIAVYLGLSLSPAQITAIGEQHTIEQQQQRIASFDFEKSGHGQGYDRHDPTTLLHKNHIASGEPLRWMKVLSRLQAGFLEYVAYDWLRKRQYRITQNMVVRALARLKYRRYCHAPV